LIFVQDRPARPIALPEYLYPINRTHLKETAMQKTVLTILATSLIVGAMLQSAGAAERHIRKSDRVQAPASQQFRNANDSLVSPSAEQRDWSDYSEGHVISAPAGQ
jgi:hypothetical protein